MTQQTPPEEDYVALPGVRDLSPAAPWRWLRAGWADFRRAPALSLAYGLVLVLTSYAITAVAFAVSAFSLPMMMDRRADVISAVSTSFLAVLRNKGAMVIWAGIILASVLQGFATAYIGLMVSLPVIGYATWHACQDAIDASDAGGSK